MNHVTVEEYLTNPAYEHCEWVDGEVVGLHVGTKKHARIQVSCVLILGAYLRDHAVGYLATELHCRLRIAGRTVFRPPDVAVVLNDTDDRDRYLDRAPDFVIEIRSPEDAVQALLRKMRDYFANGTRLAWLILPEEQSVVVLTPDGPPAPFSAGDTLDGGNVLPGLTVPVSDLFV